MKLQLNRATLLWRATMLQKIITTKSVPILNDIMFSIEGDQLELTTTDNEIRMKTTMSVQGDGTACRFCLNANDIISAISTINDDNISIHIDEEEGFTLRHRLGEVKLLCDNADEYPVASVNSYDEGISLKGLDIRDAIKRCIWATANYQLRRALMGVYVGCAEGRIDIVATDGHSLVRTRIPHQGKDFHFIMNKKVATTLMSAIEANEDILISCNENSCKIEQSSYTMEFVLPEDRFPNYNKVIPEHSSIVLTVDRNDMLYALQNVLQFTDASLSRMVKIDISNNNINLTGSNDIYNKSSHIDIPTECTGEKILIGANGAALTHMFNRMRCDKLKLKLTSPDRPIMVEPDANEEGCQVLMLLMPLIIDK